MRYAAKIYVTDLMDQVVVQAEVLEWDGLSRAPLPLTARLASVQGRGIDDPVRWLQDALHRTLWSDGTTEEA